MIPEHAPTTNKVSVHNKVRPPTSPELLRLLEIPADSWEAIEKLTAELERIAAAAKARQS